jgi:hypothetical protein
MGSMNSTKTIIVAAAFGCCAGAVAALTSATKTPPSAPAVAVVGPIQSSGPHQSADTVPQSVTTSFRVSEGVAPLQPGDGQLADSLVLRARALSREPDVQALVGLRRDFLQDARRRGVANAAETKQRLAEIDRALHDARLLRLKLDGQQLRKMAAQKP